MYSRVRQKVDGYSSGCGCLWVRGGGEMSLK